jgi:hypothetical protein
MNAMTPDYVQTADIGQTSIQIGLGYLFEPGCPELRPTMLCPGEPGEPATAYIGEVYWRPDADSAPWKRADACLAALLMDALGGEDALVAELVAIEGGRAETAACDAAEARRDALLSDWLSAAP